ncbi:MAG: 1-acyl-sn-glycerol-3-phosphate acyltransferase [Faecalibacterium prausnitzii]
MANHRSYYDIPLLLAGLDKPHGILAKEELEKIPLLNRWMKLLGCVFVQRGRCARLGAGAERCHRHRGGRPQLRHLPRGHPLQG